MTPDLLERLRAIETVCQRYGVPLAAAALQFSLRDSRIHSTIIGMTRPERLEQTVALARHPVPPALWEELDAIPTQQADPELNRWES